MFILLILTKISIKSITHLFLKEKKILRTKTQTKVLQKKYKYVINEIKKQEDGLNNLYSARQYNFSIKGFL